MDFEPKTINLSVKWNKETVSLSLSETEDLDSLRVKLYSLTQVLPEKQKLLFKGKFLKEGSSSLKENGISDVS